MPATNFNHVSVVARNVDESLAFYIEVLGMERIPSPVFRRPTAWLRLGDQELHLAEGDTSPPPYPHFAVTVDDFEAVYLKVMALGVQDSEAWGYHIYELPDGAVQLYMRDPADNLVEVDWPDITTLDTAVVTNLRKLADDYPQPADAPPTPLFLAPRDEARQG